MHDRPSCRDETAGPVDGPVALRAGIVRPRRRDLRPCVAKLVLLGDEPLDPAVNLFVVHGFSPLASGTS
jgi:hypothetical protein